MPNLQHLENAKRGWEAIVSHLHLKGGCPAYLERAERTVRHYEQMIARAR